MARADLDNSGPAGASNRGARLDWLEFLRFVLSLTVVVYHYFYFGPLFGFLPRIGEPAAFLSFGLLAVHAFFVVSGFVILLSAEGKSVGDFIVARFARLGPTLLVCGTLTFLCLRLHPMTPPIEAKVSAYVTTILVVPLSAFEGIDWSLWSLKYEIIFYGGVAAAIALRDRIRLPLETVLAACLVFESALIAASTIAPEAMTLAPLGIYGSFFALGILLYLRHTGRATRTTALLVVLALVNASVEIAWDLDRVARMLSQPAVTPTAAVVAALVILALVAASLRETRSARLRRMFRLAGMISFPLYAVHQMIGYWLINIVEPLTGGPSILVRLGMVALSVAVAGVIATSIEPMLMRRYREAGTRFMQKAAGLLQPAASTSKSVS